MSTLRRLMVTISVPAVLLLSAAQEEKPAAPPDIQVAPSPPVSEVQQTLREQSEALRPLMKSNLGTSFLNGAKSLPTLRPPTIYRDLKTGRYMSGYEYDQLDSLAQGNTKVYETTERFFYFTKYGTPVAYARAIDLIGQAGLSDLASKKVLDFGYGGIGQLRMMASQGAHVVGLDVDSMLTAMYGMPGMTGPFSGENGVSGTVTLAEGRLSEEAVSKEVGDGYDLIISKNTLKRGYLHPMEGQDVDPRQLISLGLDDAAFVQSLFDRLKPGGYLMIYNISPKQANIEAGERYMPWADGRCAFDRELLEKAGFTVIEYDRNDDGAAREMGHLLKWDEGDKPMDLQNDLFAHYTLARKPAAN